MNEQLLDAEMAIMLKCLVATLIFVAFVIVEGYIMPDDTDFDDYQRKWQRRNPTRTLRKPPVDVMAGDFFGYNEAIWTPEDTLAVEARELRDMVSLGAPPEVVKANFAVARERLENAGWDAEEVLKWAYHNARDYDFSFLGEGETDE